MSSAVRPSKTESRLDYEVNQASHGFSVGTILTHTGSAYAAAKADSASNCEVIGIVSEVADANNFTVQTSGHLTGLSGLTAGTVYFLSDTTAGAATSTEPTISKPVYYASSTTEATMLNFRGSDSTLTGASGDMVLISTATAANSTTIEFTGLDSTYTSYLVTWENYTPSTDGTQFNVRSSSDNGSTFDSGASTYAYCHNETQQGGSENTFSSAGNTYILLTGNTGNAAGESCCGELLILGSNNTSEYTHFISRSSRVRSDAVYTRSDVSGVRKEAAVVDAIQFFVFAGNLATGTFKLYGIK